MLTETYKIICNKCGKPKDKEEYYYLKGKIHGRICKQCKGEYVKARYKTDPVITKTRVIKWQKNNPVKVREYKLRIKYNLTQEQYNDMLLKQNGCCAICRCKPDKVLYVDHNHITNKVRGLLCHKCNSGIGYFNDSISLLIKAIQYLRIYF